MIYYVVVLLVLVKRLLGSFRLMKSPLVLVVQWLLRNVVPARRGAETTVA